MLPQTVPAIADSCSNSEGEEAPAATASAIDAAARASAAERSSLQLRVVLMVLRVAKRCVQTSDCFSNRSCHLESENYARNFRISLSMSDTVVMTGSDSSIQPRICLQIHL